MFNHFAKNRGPVFGGVYGPGSHGPVQTGTAATQAVQGSLAGGTAHTPAQDAEFDNMIAGQEQALAQAVGQASGSGGGAQGTGGAGTQEETQLMMQMLQMMQQMGLGGAQSA